MKQYGLVTLQTSLAGVKVDREGNIYLGTTTRPKDHILPKDLEVLSPQARQLYQWFYGSIVKFGPRGGRDVYLNPKDGLVVSPANPKERERLKPCSLEGAIWIHPGYSPLVSRGPERTAPACACRSNRFDLDDYGRLFVPDGVQGRIEVLDTNGNTIGFFGRRGPVAPNLEFRWPTMVVAGDEDAWVLDELHSAVTQVKLIYTTNEEAALAP